MGGGGGHTGGGAGKIGVGLGGGQEAASGHSLPQDPSAWSRA